MAGGLFKVKVTGAQKLVANLMKVQKTHPRAVNAALYTEAIETAKAALPRTLLKTGRLRESLGVTKPRASRGESSSTVGYGAPYAVYAHERTDINPTTEGTQAKFLEVVFRRRRSGYFRRLARLVGKYIGDKTHVGQIDSPFPTQIRDPLGE